MADKVCNLGIDIGTTSVKAVAFDDDRYVIAKSTDELTLIANSDGMAEQDPSEVYEKLTGVMTNVISSVRELGYSVEVVGFSAAMHSVMLVSSEGQPLGNALTWMDGRAHDTAQRVWAEDFGRFLYHRTGTPVHPMSPMVKLIWMRQNMEREFLSASKFVSLKEWVWYHWFGTWEVDESMASATGLFHLQTRDWDEQALAFVQIAPGQLSRVVKTCFSRMACREQRLLTAGLSKETRFNIGASDGVLANLGVGAVHTGMIALTMGTSLAVRLLSETPQTHEELRSFCYILDDNRYIIGGPSNSGGIVLDWIYNHAVTSQGTMSDAIQAAEAADTDGLFCLPYFSGERAPLWDSEVRASFVGLGLQHAGIHMLRAGIEGILFNAYWIASELFAQVGKPNVVIASGKLFETEWVRQLLADIFDIPVRADFLSDASILGAVDLAENSLRRESAGEQVYSCSRDRDIPVNLEAAGAGESQPEEALLLPQNPGRYRTKYKQFRRLVTAFQTANESSSQHPNEG